MQDTTHYPPPWKLKGEGFLIPFLGNKQELIKTGFMTEEDRESFRGGLGACMLVNYESSDVGPYFELLFIPGDFEHKAPGKRSKVYKRITKIFVSSDVSIQEGRLNWAIPKEYAKFTWRKEGNTTKITAATKDNLVFFEAEFLKRYFSFPITTKIYPVSLLQKSDDSKLINTKFTGSGKGNFASILKLVANEDYFPDLRKNSKFNFGLSVNDFNIVFPIPEIL